MALSHVAQMTTKDVLAIVRAFLSGKWTVSASDMDSRITWAAYDTCGQQVIGIKPINTAYFFLIDVS